MADKKAAPKADGAKTAKSKKAATDAAPQQATAAGAPDQSAAQLNVLAQYVKDLSFESPNAPASLQAPGDNPTLEVNVNVQARKQGDDMYETALHFEAKAANPDNVIYNIELVYAGLFRLTSIPENLLQPVLFVDCPAMLFPFMRRLVADLTREGGYPPLYLDPIDFPSLYRQNAERMQAQGVTAPVPG
jgi:preprotein translocase subunit SecB